MKSSKIGQQIGRLRTERNLTQTQLGQAIKVSKNTIEKWENGRNAIKDEMIVKLADYFNVSCDELLLDRKPENHIVCNQLGLKNETVNSLSELNLMAKTHEGQEQEYYSNLLNTVDILIMNQDLLATLSGYFFHDFSQLAVVNEKGFSTIQLTNGGTYTIEDNANRFRLRIMDKLKTIRDELKGGSNK